MSFIITTLRMLAGTIFVLFIPGFLMTLIFFPPKESRENKKIGFAKRIVLSITFSIAIIPLIVFYLNWSGLIMTPFNLFIVIAESIMFIGIILFFIEKSKFREINFNIHYVLFVSVILGIFSFIFPPKEKN